MAQPGETITRTFKVVTAADVPVTGLLTADFTLAGYRNGAASTITFTIAELGSGRYSVAYVLPSTAGLVDAWFLSTNTSNYIVWPDLTEEVETQDFGSLAAAVIRTTVALTATGAPSNEIALTVTKDNYHAITFTVKDSAGVAIDLSGWDTWRFGVKSSDQAATIYLQTTGITASVAGVVTVILPETATVFTSLLTGINSITHRWSLEGNEAADLTKTRTIARGDFLIVRKET